MNKKILICIAFSIIHGRYINAMQDQRISLKKINPHAYSSLQQELSIQLNDRLSSTPTGEQRLNRLKKNKKTYKQALERLNQKGTNQTGDFEALLKYEKSLEELEATQTPKVIAAIIQEIKQEIQQLKEKAPPTLIAQLFTTVISKSKKEKRLHQVLKDAIEQLNLNIDTTQQEAGIMLCTINVLQRKDAINTEKVPPKNKELSRQIKKPSALLQFTKDLLSYLKLKSSALDINYVDLTYMLFLLNEKEASKNKTIQQPTKGKLQNILTQELEKKLKETQKIIQQQQNNIQLIKTLLTTVYKDNDSNSLVNAVKKIRAILNQKEPYTSPIRNIIQQINANAQKTDEQQFMQGPCNVCKKESLTLCSQCEQVFYCSEEHQIQDWDNHEPKCDQQQEKAAQIAAAAEEEEYFKIIYQNDQLFVIDNQEASYDILNEFLKIQDDNGVIYELCLDNNNNNRLSYQNTKTQQKCFVCVEEQAMHHLKFENPSGCTIKIIECQLPQHS